MTRLCDLCGGWGVYPVCAKCGVRVAATRADGVDVDRVARKRKVAK